MDFKKLIELIDKHVNQEALAKDLLIEYVIPVVEEKLKAIDPIAGTQIDNEVIAKIIDFLKAQAK